MNRRPLKRPYLKDGSPSRALIGRMWEDDLQHRLSILRLLGRKDIRITFNGESRLKEVR